MSDTLNQDKKQREMKRLAEHHTPRDIDTYSDCELAGRGVFGYPLHHKRKRIPKHEQCWELQPQSRGARIGDEYQVDVPEYQGPYEPEYELKKGIAMEKLFELAELAAKKKDFDTLVRVSDLMKHILNEDAQ